MKKYSTSKLLVALVIVSFLSLPFCLAKGKPQPEPEPVWSVYIPENINVGSETVLNGLQGIPGTANEDGFYVFDGSNPASRNFVNYLYQNQSYFNFEILLKEENPLSVQLNGLGEYSCSVEYSLTACAAMFDQISSEQPNGEWFNLSDDALGHSERIWFGFDSWGDYNYEDQEIDDPSTEFVEEGARNLHGGHLSIDSALVGDPLAYHYKIFGSFVDQSLKIIRIDENTWKITGFVEKIAATHHEQELRYEDCGRKNCKPYLVFTTYAEGEVGFGKNIELYFVRN